MFILAGLAWPQATALAPVIARPMSRTIDLPAELLPFLSVSLHAKVAGYVERVLVDRGSAVREGDLLVEVSAPELAGANRRGPLEGAGRRIRPAPGGCSTRGRREHL